MDDSKQNENMAAGKSSFSWKKFFEDAGIPPTHANSYAEVFEDNR